FVLRFARILRRLGEQFCNTWQRFVESATLLCRRLANFWITIVLEHDADNFDESLTRKGSLQCHDRYLSLHGVIALPVLNKLTREHDLLKAFLHISNFFGGAGLNFCSSLRRIYLSLLNGCVDDQADHGNHNT